MKIGIAITSLGVAGGTKCLMLLASGLRERGHEVRLFCPSHSLKNHMKSLFFPPRITWTEETYTFSSLRSLEDIPQLDALIAGPWRAAVAAKVWLEKYGGKALYYVQHDESLWDGGEEAARTYTFPLKKVVISSWLQNMLKETYGQDSVLCVTPVDQELFDVTPLNEQRSRRVLMLHHTFDWKGFEDGVKAFESVQKKTGRNDKLVVVGGRVADPNLPAGTEYYFRPSQEKIREVYASCGTFLCSSWYEGLGMPSMEAMATGALLVTTDTGGSRDYAIADETAFVSPPKDVNALADNLERALKGWQECRHIRESGREKIREYSWKDNLDKIESLIS